MMRMNLLQTVHDHVVQAITEGRTLKQFAGDLRPILEQEGWWGKKEGVDPDTGEIKTVQLGSPRRLEIIYDTNLRTAYSAGRWQRAQRGKARLPYLLYRTMRDARVRPLHRQWDGVSLPQDDDWWDTHYPPNGWRCRCVAYPVSDADLGRLDGAFQDSGGQRGVNIKRQTPPTETVQWVNPRTGEVRQIPVGIDPGFDYNPGKAPLHPLTPPPLDGALPATPVISKAPAPPEPQRLPSDRLLPDGLTDEAYARAFLAEFGAAPETPEIFRDVLDEPLVIGKELFQDGYGNWKANKKGRGPYMLMLADAIKTPDEIWLSWEEMRASPGKWLLKRRYIKAFDLEDARFGLAVFEWSKAGWRGATTFLPDSAEPEARRRIDLSERQERMMTTPARRHPVTAPLDAQAGRIS